MAAREPTSLGEALQQALHVTASMEASIEIALIKAHTAIRRAIRNETSTLTQPETSWPSPCISLRWTASISQLAPPPAQFKQLDSG